MPYAPTAKDIWLILYSVITAFIVFLPPVRIFSGWIVYVFIITHEKDVVKLFLKKDEKCFFEFEYMRVSCKFTKKETDSRCLFTEAEVRRAGGLPPPFFGGVRVKRVGQVSLFVRFSVSPDAKEQDGSLNLRSCSLK